MATKRRRGGDRCQRCGLSATSLAETFASAIDRERRRADVLRAAIVAALDMPPRHRDRALKAALDADKARGGT